MHGTQGPSAGMNHVGLTVGDIDKAIRWYQDTFGLILLVGPLHCDTATAGAARRNEVFGSQWAGMKLAHMLTDNGCGLELFEFVIPKGEPPGNNFQYWKYGASHIAFTVDDFDRTLEMITSTGGRARTQVHDVHGGIFICYCEDPWGNIIEIVSKPYEQLSAATAL